IMASCKKLISCTYSNDKSTVVHRHLPDNRAAIRERRPTKWTKTHFDGLLDPGFYRQSKVRHFRSLRKPRHEEGPDDHSEDHPHSRDRRHTRTRSIRLLRGWTRQRGDRRRV